MKDLVVAFVDFSSNGMSEYILDNEEWAVIDGLVSALKTQLYFFNSNTPSIASIIPAMDAINEALATGIIDNNILSEPI
ncbi:hypothetical protein BT96DRAFT_1006994 [Gymnopus androsaceus JB14]|uniref:Uncharacterized protein n=1 Tax=Gymnopus androsaceus JB14 TaxID=1447944 RepID=A0A6A4GJD6_9AGAR|nr:hypothetical protein BT96DRAFT_1006994 [Gymnopus androsaceus JB14]